MSLFKECCYLFDTKLKLKFCGMMLIILIGSLAELLGVSMILPIVELAMNPQAVTTNAYCRMIARITGYTDSTKIMLALIACVVALYLVKNIYLSFQAYAINRFSKNTRLHFSTRLMEAYMKQPYSYFLYKNTSEILRSVNTDTGNMYTVIANLLQVISQGFTAFLLVVYLAWTNLTMTLSVAGLLLLCALIIILGVQRKMRAIGKEYQKVGAGIIKYAKQAFEGIKEVKIMNKERYFISEYRNVYKKATSIELVYNLLSYIPKYIIETVCIAGIMGYLAVVIRSGGRMSQMIPQLSVFVGAVFRLLPSINTLYTDLSNILYDKASIDLIYHDIREVDAVKTEEFIDGLCEPLNFQDTIEVSNLTFAYANTSRNVLENVSVRIHKGESVAFIGESGGGKTTLVDNILGILVPQKGAVTVDGRNILEIGRSWHRDIGYIPQQIFLMDDTIRKNVAFGIAEEDMDDAKVWQALSEAKLADFVRGLEKGLDTEVGEAGMRLSGGQRQRIGIARALYHDPDILVFDEATSALDNETEKEVMEAIDGLHGSKTMMMIAHRLTTIENCDHVYRVENGALLKVR